MAAYRPRAQRRSNGEGSIYRAADGRWRGTLSITHPTNGQQARRYVSGRSRAEVARKIEGLRRDAAGGAFPSGITTAQFLQDWLVADRQRVRPSTWRQREQYVRLYLIPALGRLPVARVAPADVERMTAGLVAAGRSQRTAAHARVILRRALADAQRDGLVARNVAALARPPRVEEPPLRYLEPSELRHLLATTDDHPMGPLIALAATTGMRQGELLGLAWSDVDLEAGRLTVRRALARSWAGGWALAEPKTQRSRRTLHLPARAVKALTEQRARQAAARAAAGTAWQDRDGLVFTDTVGRPLHGYTVGATFTRLVAGAGLAHIRFHGLRHSAATALLAGGVPLRVVADQLGHSTITITANTYTGVVPELRKDAADAMDRMLGS